MRTLGSFLVQKTQDLSRYFNLIIEIQRSQNIVICHCLADQVFASPKLLATGKSPYVSHPQPIILLNNYNHIVFDFGRAEAQCLNWNLNESKIKSSIFLRFCAWINFLLNIFQFFFFKFTLIIFFITHVFQIFLLRSRVGNTQHINDECKY